MAYGLEPLVRKFEAESSLSGEEKAAVLNLQVTIRAIPADSDVIRDGDRPSQCCLVLDGWLQRYKILNDGQRQILAFHIPGDIPDLQSLHLRTMDHNLAPLVQSKVAIIQHDTIRELIRSFPRLGDVLWRDTLIDAAIFRHLKTDGLLVTSESFSVWFRARSSPLSSPVSMRSNGCACSLTGG